MSVLSRVRSQLTQQVFKAFYIALFAHIEILVQNIFCDPTHRATATGSLTQNRNGDLRIVGRSEADERTVVRGTVDADLGGTGLGRDLNGVIAEDLKGGAGGVRGHLFHTFCVGDVGVVGDIQYAEDLRLVLQDQIAVLSYMEKYI